jgi:Ca2+-binding RTX toxin-like protein
MASFSGDSGDNTFTGTSDADFFAMSQGGEDTVFGLGGNDFFEFDAALSVGDHIDGGDGVDQLYLRGVYTVGNGNAIMLGSGNLTSIEQLVLGTASGSTIKYDITADDSAVAADQTLAIICDSGGSGKIQFDGSAEMDGSFDFDLIRFADDLTIVLGAGDDQVTTRSRVSLNLYGGAGNDYFQLVAPDFVSATTHIDGGIGFDTLRLGYENTSLGIAFVTISSPIDITGIEQIYLPTAWFQVRVNDATVASGKSLIVDFSSQTPEDQGIPDNLDSRPSYFDGSKEIDGHLVFVAGSGKVTVDGGGASDSFDLTRGGLITARGNGGSDTFVVGNRFTEGMNLDGGVGGDTLVMRGDYSRGVDLSAVHNLETIKLGALYNYDLTIGDATIAAGKTLHVLGSVLGSDDILVLDASAELDGRLDVTGGAGNDAITGGAGNDKLSGGGLNDTLAGGDGSDNIHGDKGKDTLTGGNGDDVLTGGSGADTLNGGAGNDTFLFQTSDSSPNGSDVVEDFTSGDLIDLHKIDANKKAAGDQAFTLGGSAFTNTAGELIQYDDGHGHTVLAGDANGDGVADIQILLSGNPTLTTSDFAL